MPNPKAGIYPCNVCHEVFEYPAQLVSHLSVHILGVEGFICPTCSMRFRTYQLLQQHYLVHSDPSFPCDFCSKAFRREGALKQHRNAVHFKMKQHKCDLCNKSFAELANLRRHWKVHTGAKDYKCSNCGAFLATPYSLTQHKKTKKCANNSLVRSMIQPLPDGNVATSTAHVVAISPTLVTTTASVATPSGITTITEHQHLGVGVTTVTAFSQLSATARLQQLAGSLVGNQSGLPNDNNLTTSVFYGVDFAASCPLDEIPEITD